MSRNDLWNLDNTQLKVLYEREMEQLHQQLLNGVSWQETTDQRKKVAEISNVMYKKQNPRHFSNPAEGRRREHE